MTPEIILVFIILILTVVLFATEALRVDVIAILVMLTVGWFGLVTPLETFSGFASNAVVSVMSVMILGYGIDRTGVMIKFARKIVLIAGPGETRLIGVISSVVGLLSAFMQNIGSAALFLPAIIRISKKTKIPRSRLIMPMGFSAILGGTLSMVGSSPLILLNDLMLQGNLEPFGIFSVTPIGVVLLATGILYFIFLGKRVLPVNNSGAEGEETQESLIEIRNLPKEMYHYKIPRNSPLVGKTRDEIAMKSNYSIHLLAIISGGDVLYAPWRYTVFSEGQIVSLLGKKDDVIKFADDFFLVPEKNQQRLTEIIGEENAGFAEIIVHPHSAQINKTLREISFRKNYGLEIILFLSSEGEKRKDFFDIPLSQGDTFVVYGPWNKIEKIKKGSDFLLITPVEEKELKKSKGLTAVLCFAGGIFLTFTGMPISIGLLSGALAMILLGVIKIDEAYTAIDWKTIFLLAGLIPLGIAMDKTGTAAFIAENLIHYFGDTNPILILFIIAILTTFFSTFMSNVAATVLLVPLVIILGSSIGIDPRGLALLVGVCASNSFILPTHQVNAFLMTPGGYHNSDYLKAGGLMTILFLLVAVGLIYILFV
ncbi:SLC13 family permease [Methanoplanus sp. FWC-SCC4]|uniref:SLC13 family permease n=1 Tax=Methanochimaera problematica TaxID=2609417 RepID=A0AA97FE64_9EURY|nr:SLC13 family permease [Methanoplanus sp. FWC-SCC4]WOF16388.1 SLC13 family permease [Methanoplanus sp. FWC-SCC4]